MTFDIHQSFTPHPHLWLLHSIGKILRSNWGVPITKKRQYSDANQSFTPHLHLSPLHSIPPVLSSLLLHSPHSHFRRQRCRRSYSFALQLFFPWRVSRVRFRLWKSQKPKSGSRKLGAPSRFWKSANLLGKSRPKKRAIFTKGISWINQATKSAKNGGRNLAFWLVFQSRTNLTLLDTLQVLICDQFVFLHFFFQRANSHQ